MPNYLGPVSVPQDTLTAAAYQLIQDVAAGGDGHSVIFSLDMATKTSVCQRAMDLLSMPPCSMVSSDPTWAAAKGDCLDDSSNPDAYKVGPLFNTLIPGVIAACKTAGVSVHEELSPMIYEPGIGLLVGGVAGGFIGHHFGGHAVIGVLAGALLGVVAGSGLYKLQASRVPVQQAQS